MSVLRDDQCLSMSVIRFIARSMQFDDVVSVHQTYCVSIVPSQAVAYLGWLVTCNIGGGSSVTNIIC